VSVHSCLYKPLVFCVLKSCCLPVSGEGVVPAALCGAGREGEDEKCLLFGSEF